MPLPISANTKCQVYRPGNSPPSAADVADVPGVLKADFGAAQEARDALSGNFHWTHVLLVSPDADIRDGYVGNNIVAPTTADRLYIPETNGTPFDVIFVELLLRGTPNEHKRIYLDRLVPPWPTNEL